MREVCCQFGRRRQLAGVVTEPVGAAATSAFVLVSAGLIPKFGPFRLYAELARRLARSGVLTLRFDLSGIGDSGLEFPGEPLKRRTELEIRAALDYLSERYRTRSVVLGGLCSGAEDAFRYAELDGRVSGVVMVDPFSYKVPGWRWRDLRNRFLRRFLRTAGLRAPHAPANAGPALVNYKNIEHAESSRILSALIERKARVHFVYTGGMDGAFNHRGQLKTMFPGIDFSDRVALDFFPRLDHTQPLESDRRPLIEAIARGFRP